MTGRHHQGLVLGQCFQVIFYQAILHPVLADRSGFTIGHQFVRVEGNVKIKVVIDHHLEGFSGKTPAFVGFDRLGLDGSGRSEPITINSAACHELV